MVLHDRQIAGTIKVLTVAVLTVMFLIAGSSSVQAEEVQGPDKEASSGAFALTRIPKESHRLRMMRAAFTLQQATPFTG